MKFFYVYGYFEGDTPVYIGKGSGRRCDEHKGSPTNPGLIRWIWDRKSRGLPVEPRMLAEGLSEIDALNTERDLSFVTDGETTIPAPCSTATLAGH